MNHLCPLGVQYLPDFRFAEIVSLFLKLLRKGTHTDLGRVVQFNFQSSLVNILVKLQMLISNICQYFLLKKI